MSMIEIFNAGGPIMWPLLACSLFALGIILERAYSLRASRILNPTIVERVTGLAEGGRVDRAIEVCRASPGIYTNIVIAGLESVDKGEAEAREAVEGAGRHESTLLNRYLGALGTVAAVTPLLGLLGTVTGMIEVFQTIAESGGAQAAQLSSGISTALITTATGLCIAIPTLVAHNIYQERVSGIMTDLERESLRVIRGLYRGSSAAAKPVAAAAD